MIQAKRPHIDAKEEVLGLNGVDSIMNLNEIWTRGEWHGEIIWSSECGPWKALISETRARLIYLGSAASDDNILHVPETVHASDDYFPMGGHVLWLGPQSRWVWPPPSDWSRWEDIELNCDGLELSLRHTQENLAFPRLLRLYFWDKGELVCTVKWEGGEAFHVVHILQVPKEVIVHGEANSELSADFRQFRGFDMETDFPFPAGVVREGEQLTFSYTGESGKLGLKPQILRAVRGKLGLEMKPCAALGGNKPDAGYITQIWRGNADLPFVEIEQLSAFAATSDGTATSIRLRPYLLV